MIMYTHNTLSVSFSLYSRNLSGKTTQKLGTSWKCAKTKNLELYD